MTPTVACLIGLAVGVILSAALAVIGIVWWASQFHDPSDASEEALKPEGWDEP